MKKSKFIVLIMVAFSLELGGVQLLMDNLQETRKYLQILQSEEDGKWRMKTC